MRPVHSAELRDRASEFPAPLRVIDNGWGRQLSYLLGQTAAGLVLLAKGFDEVQQLARLLEGGKTKSSSCFS